MTTAKKMPPKAGQGLQRAGVAGSDYPQDTPKDKNCQLPCTDRPPFAYIKTLLLGYPTAQPITDPASAWGGIVAQLGQARPAVVDSHHLREARCRLEGGRLVVVLPFAGSAEWARELAAARTRPLAVAAALAGLGRLEIEFK